MRRNTLQPRAIAVNAVIAVIAAMVVATAVDAAVSEECCVLHAQHHARLSALIAVPVKPQSSRLHPVVAAACSAVADEDVTHVVLVRSLPLSRSLALVEEQSIALCAMHA